MKKPLVNVSDHAVLRYLELVKGMDIEAVRREVGRTADLHLEHPGASCVVAGGFRYRISDGVVTTVTPHNQPDRRSGRGR